MLKTYIELINKHFAKEYKKMMRDWVRKLYTPSLTAGDGDHHIAKVWVPSDGKRDDTLVEDNLMDLLYECVKRDYHFGDYTVINYPVTDGTPNPRYTYTAFEVRLPIRM